jgi:hypothetical protein
MKPLSAAHPARTRLARAIALSCAAACLVFPAGCADKGFGVEPREDVQIRPAAGPVDPQPATRAEGAAARPAPILHIVLIRLKNPLDTAELSEDCLAAAAQIPSITSALAGLHLETGRDTVTRDYDLCFTLGFDTREGLVAYVDHPAHLALLEKWRPRVEWLRIYDAQDVRP